jgi:hypothetical protein
MVLLIWLPFCLRTFVAAVLIVYSCSKLQNLSHFAEVIRSHRLIPDSLSNPVALVLSLFELMLGLLFLFNVFPLLIGITISVLLLLFSSVLLRARIKAHLNIQNCGCSGVNNRGLTIEKALFRNCLLVGAVWTVIILGGMSRFISPILLFLIETALFMCILAGIHIIRNRSLPFILNRHSIGSRSCDGSTSAATGIKRRAFIKWGIATFIGISTLWNIPLQAFAYQRGNCPSGVACACDSAGMPGSDCWTHYDCNGHEGEVVPVYTTCETYCCDRSAGCASRTYQSGEHDCSTGCP